mmetsp:Transcript_86372/g.247864  ORF Transcript_86372/g.247864 Transcript_86372/m.247864 type:complete len:243 (+) Transcript_86372:375-1103(+)
MDRSRRASSRSPGVRACFQSWRSTGVWSPNPASSCRSLRIRFRTMLPCSPLVDRLSVKCPTRRWRWSGISSGAGSTGCEARNRHALARASRPRWTRPTRCCSQRVRTSAAPRSRSSIACSPRRSSASQRPCFTTKASRSREQAAGRMSTPGSGRWRAARPTARRRATSTRMCMTSHPRSVVASPPAHQSRSGQPRRSTGPTASLGGCLSSLIRANPLRSAWSSRRRTAQRQLWRCSCTTRKS